MASHERSPALQGDEAERLVSVFMEGVNVEHVATVRVIFGDTDAGGIVYYGNYLRWFEVGRMELMRRKGFSYLDSMERGCSSRHRGKRPVSRIRAVRRRAPYPRGDP